MRLDKCTMQKTSYISHILIAIIEETVRMGTPGQYYGPVVSGGGMKQDVIHCFKNEFPIDTLLNKRFTEDQYKRMHKDMVEKLYRVINNNIRQLEGHNRKAFPICAKLVDTFMHQLIKYEQFRHLYKNLFLPLDGQVFKKFSHGSILDRAVEFPQEIIGIAKRMGAYEISSSQYYKIQNHLLVVLTDFNTKMPKRFKLKARIQLNAVLWL